MHNKKDNYSRISTSIQVGAVTLQTCFWMLSTLFVKKDYTQTSNTYRIGTIILHKEGDSFQVVDGQQRIISLTLLNIYLDRNFEVCKISHNIYRPAQNKRGNGLGLVIVKAVCDIVKAHTKSFSHV